MIPKIIKIPTAVLSKVIVVRVGIGVGIGVEISVDITACFTLGNIISNGHSTANLSSANFVNVASTRGCVFGMFRVDVVTRQTRRHSPRRVARTRQTCRHSPSRVARTRQTPKHSPKAIFEKNLTHLDKFA